MTMDNGVMKMRPVEGGLEIQPGETVALNPSGVHMMLIDLRQHPLEQGKTAAAILDSSMPAQSTSSTPSLP